MGRKKRRHRHHTLMSQSNGAGLSALKDIVAGGRDTLARLTTTVASSDIDAGRHLGTVSNAFSRSQAQDLYRPFSQAASQPTKLSATSAPLSRLASALNPVPRIASMVRRRSTQRKLAEVAREIDRQRSNDKSYAPALKRRRSRLPLLVLILLLALGSGGYYLYDSFSIPQQLVRDVERSLDYKKWLGLVAGLGQRDATKVTTHTDAPSRYESLRVPQSSSAPSAATAVGSGARHPKSTQHELWRQQVSRERGAKAWTQAKSTKATGSQVKHLKLKTASKTQRGAQKGVSQGGRLVKTKANSFISSTKRTKSGGKKFLMPKSGQKKTALKATGKRGSASTAKYRDAKRTGTKKEPHRQVKRGLTSRSTAKRR